MMTDGGRGGCVKREEMMEACMCTCWSSVFEGPGPCWGLAGLDCVGVHERVCACASAGVSASESVRWRAGWRNRRSPVTESSRSRWRMSRCGSDSGVYPLPRL